MIGKRKDPRRIQVRNDRYPYTLMGAITLAAILLLWLPRGNS
jgi:hypothetical protein